MFSGLIFCGFLVVILRGVVFCWVICGFVFGSGGLMYYFTVINDVVGLFYVLVVLMVVGVVWVLCGFILLIWVVVLFSWGGFYLDFGCYYEFSTPIPFSLCAGLFVSGCFVSVVFILLFGLFLHGSYVSCVLWCFIYLYFVVCYLCGWLLVLVCIAGYSGNLREKVKNSGFSVFQK